MSLFDTIRDLLGSAASDALGGVGEAVTGATEGLSGIGETVTGSLGDLAGGLGEAGAPLGDLAGGASDLLTGSTDGLADGIGT